MVAAAVMIELKRPAILAASPANIDQPRDF